MRLSEDQYIIWGFVTESSCILHVLNVVYMNDGLSDTCNITVYVDGGQLVGSFDTRAQSHLPISSGPIGATVMSSGDHTIKLTATNMNEYGIEIDRMTLEMICTSGMSTSDGACPNPQEADLENCKAPSNHDSWDKKLIIGLAFEIFFAIVEAILLFFTIYFHIIRKIKKGDSDDKHSVTLVKYNVNNEEVQIPLLQETMNNNIDDLPVPEPRRSTC